MALAFAFWTLVGLFYSTQVYIFASPEGNWAHAFERAMPRWYIWGILAPCIIWFDRRLSLRQTQLRDRLLVHLPLGVLWTLVFMGLHILKEPLLQGTFPELSMNLFAHHFYGNFPIYWLILGVYVAHEYYTAAQQREVKAAQLEKHLTEARLRMLRMQLHPHFLFNTLNAVAAYVEKDPIKARRMVTKLGTLLRFSVDRSDKQEIPLAEELELLESYLDIEQIRFEGQLFYSTHIAPEAMEALVPTFLLQPLVENAIRHGITARTGEGHVAVEARRINNTLSLEIRDDGVGLPEDWQQTKDNGVGLANTAERLSELYGEHYRFQIRNAPDGGVVVETDLPFRTVATNQGNPKTE